ncbi:MAG TPA: AMP-binding protein [Acidimicrobiia bacterium]|nr:AMP-binding protein [Acidimicrobiia bacterium]
MDDDTIAVLDRILRLDPAAPALQFDGRWLTYGDLTTAIDAVGTALRDAGVGPGAPVAAVVPNRPVGLIAWLAVLLEGACLVPLSPRRAADELAAVGAVTAVLGPAGTVEPAPPVDGAAGLTLRPTGPALARPGVAVLMSTSGTTGEPKRIAIAVRSIDSVVRAVRGLANGSDATPRLRDDTTLVCFPYTNLSGILPQLIALVSGRRTALLERFEPRRVARLVAEHRMTSLALNPTAMRMLLDADVDPSDLGTLRYVRSGSARLSPGLAAEFEERFDVAVLQGYGQTEVAGEVIGWSAADHRQFGRLKRGSVGRPHPGIEVRLAAPGEDPEADPVGEVGELWLRGAPNVVGWHRTGDLARIDEDGFVWIEGRADNLIICGGFNVAPLMLERVLESHPAVSEAVVVARADPRLGEVPVAVVRLQPGAHVAGEELAGWCRQRLEPYQVPRAVVVVDELPRNDAGKVHLPGVRDLACAY